VLTSQHTANPSVCRVLPRWHTANKWSLFHVFHLAIFSSPQVHLLNNSKVLSNFLDKFTKRCIYKYPEKLFHAFISLIRIFTFKKIIAPNKLEIANGSEKIPNFDTTQSLCCIAYTKCFEVKHKTRKSIRVQFIPLHSQLPESSSEILRFLHILHDNLCETFPNFFHDLHV
jgi:hypothetical protein